MSEIRFLKGKAVRCGQIIGTRMTDCEAWEPDPAALDLKGRGHSTISTMVAHELEELGLGDLPRWWGRIGTRPLPPELEALPAGSDERWKTVGKWHEEQYLEACNLIREAFPEYATGRCRMGTLTFYQIEGD